MKFNYLRHFMLGICLLSSMSISAYVEVGGIYYELDGREATVIAGKGYSGNGSIVIPATINIAGLTYNVTAIGDKAFWYCSNLSSISIPEGVKTIGNYAFAYCYQTNLNIPESVTSIGSYAYRSCGKITDVNLPALEVIGDDAFYDSGLTNLTLSEKTTSIGNYAFNSTPWYNSQPDGLVYAGKVAYKYKGTIPEGTEIIIKDGTVAIANYAFGFSSWSSNNSLISVTIAESVTTIGEYAFYYCSALSSITIPESVTRIGRYAFDGTAWYNNQPDGLVYAGRVAYGYKGSMTSGTQIRLEDGTKGIAGRAFYDKDNLAGIEIPSSVTDIEAYAFYSCNYLTSADIPNSVKSIGGYAFAYCTRLQSILIPESVTNIGNFAFLYCKEKSITVNDGNPKYDSRSGCNAIIETAKDKLILGCAYTTIPNNVVAIGDHAFAGSDLYDITIPSSVRSIGWYAFTECYNLSSINIPNGVQSIGEYAFQNSYLSTVKIPASVTSFGIGVFSYCDLISIKVDGGNAYYDSRDDCNAIIEKATNTLIVGCGSSTIPQGVKAIGDYAFSGCTGLASLDIPEGVTDIGIYAFSECGRLVSVIIPEGVTAIKDYTFSGCSRLSSITLPGSVTSIGDYAFSVCSRLSSINIPAGVTYIGNHAFSSCSLLRTITIPNGVNTLYYDSFYGCSGLTKVIIGKGLKTLDSYVFEYCENLTDVYCYAEEVPNASDYTFSGSTDLSKARLHVPEELVGAYRETYPWSEFGQIVGITESDIEQCAKPTISYTNGELKFDCATEDVGYIYEILDDDIKTGAGGKVNLSVTYQINVYATKVGYHDSEVVTGTLCWVDMAPQTEGIIGEDAVTEVKALPVLIQTEGSTIIVKGANEGTKISVYSVGGMQQASAYAAGGIATLKTSLQPGSVAIVKIGDRAVKVLMK